MRGPVSGQAGGGRRTTRATPRAASPPDTASPDTGDDSRDPAEVARFAALADRWWDADGPFKPLHRLNPARLGFMRDHASAHWHRTGATPLAGLTAVDVGCGGGLLAEPLARLGARVTAIDAAAASLAAARHHAAAMGLSIDYRLATAESLAATGARFDLVINMEVVEHVAAPMPFLAATASLCRAGGLYFGSTLNRTAKSFLLAILGAEYLLGWIPRGTHDWRRFLRPESFDRALRRAGLQRLALAGLRYHPLTGDWSLDPGDLSVNYLGCWSRPSAGPAGDSGRA